MIKKTILFFPLLVFVLAFEKIEDATLDLCSTLNLPATPFNYENVPLPDHYLNNYFNGALQNAVIDNDNSPIDNPITDAGATLGRVLFYDKKLSANGTIACASCHKQELAFSDDAVLSLGFDGGLTRRHSMGLANARFYQDGKFFWDERAATLEDQVLMPFQDPVEMGLTLAQLEQIVQGQSYYPSLFTDAFGDATIDSERISKALAQFVRSMVSIDSKYDQGRPLGTPPTVPFPNFTQAENRGKQLFINTQSGGVPCIGCHISEGFLSPVEGPNSPPNSMTSTTNNGLDSVSTTDLGVFETTGRNRDMGKFKVPSLRNIGVGAPYMHDGRFATLEEVVEHYSSGIQNHPSLFPGLKDADGNVIQYNFTETEKADLVAFLHTLTDQTFITDEKFSDPFRASIDLSLNVKLEGSFLESSSSMTDDLRQAGLLPTTEPYSALGYTYEAATSGETIDPAVLNVQGGDAIVDWVFVELRDATDSDIVLAARSALLQRDGDVVDIDGISPLNFPNTAACDYYVGIHHRNHIGVLTATPISLLAGSPNAINFSSPATNVYGTDPLKDVNGVRLLWAGDSNSDFIVNAGDRSETWNDRNETTYIGSDLNMDAICNATDRSIAWNNRNRGVQMP